MRFGRFPFSSVAREPFGGFFQAHGWIGFLRFEGLGRLDVELISLTSTSFDDMGPAGLVGDLDSFGLGVFFRTFASHGSSR